MIELIKTKKNIAYLLVVVVLSLALAGCTKVKDVSYKMKLEIWGSFDESGVYADIFKEYREINPNIFQLKYRKMDPEGYRQDLIDSMAAGKGPDIFFIQNTWLPSFKDKIVPAPAWLINEKEFREIFVDVVADDFLQDGVIYGVPLSVDSLALYYNKDIFNAEGIIQPPDNWDQVMESTKKITKIDKFGNIIQSGIALGSAYNINRAADILSLLTFQFGSNFILQENKVSFRNIKEAGVKALDFYTQFARSDSPVYCWNPIIHHSIDSFSEGKAAMMINYSWQYGSIKARNPKLNFAVSRLPQMKEGRPINFANYWALVVAKNKPVQPVDRKKPPESNEVRIYDSWQLVKFLTFPSQGKFKIINSKAMSNCLAKKEKNCFGKNVKEMGAKIDPASIYLSKTGRPAARRDILNNQMSDPVLGNFAYGNLIAKSWFQLDDQAVEKHFLEAIDSVNKGSSGPAQAMSLAQSRIESLHRR